MATRAAPPAGCPNLGTFSNRTMHARPLETGISATLAMDTLRAAIASLAAPAGEEVDHPIRRFPPVSFQTQKALGSAKKPTGDVVEAAAHREHGFH